MYRTPAVAAEEMLKDVDPDMSGKLTFLEFVDLLNSRGMSFLPWDHDTLVVTGYCCLLTGRGNLPEEGADEKVIEFLRVLDKYREQCEAEGNYLEAGRAAQQLTALRKQEAKRQEKSLKARQIAERQDVQIAHNIQVGHAGLQHGKTVHNACTCEPQFAEFNAAWDKYLEEYDQMAQEYIARMAERHAKQLEEFRVKLKEDLEKKPPKFSRELLDWRKRELLLARYACMFRAYVPQRVVMSRPVVVCRRQKKYSEAQKIKRVADELEREERSRIDEERLKTFQQKEVCAMTSIFVAFLCLSCIPG